MSAISEELISYYKALLIVQYRNKPKASATIGALIGGTGEQGLIAGAIYNQVRDGFDIETAVGKQLDFLGKLIGPDRYFFGLDLSKEFLQLPSYDDPGVGTLNGIADYEDTPMPPLIYTMTYDDFVQNTLLDGDYRRVLKFMAAVRSCDFSYATIDSICYDFFGSNVNLTVTGNMAINYAHLTSDTDDLFMIIKQMALLPTPAGVFATTSEVGSF